MTNLAQYQGFAIVLIYEDEFGEVFFHDGPDNRTLLTFSGFGVYADGSRYWGQSAVQKLGLRCVGIIARKPNWYPAPFIAAARSAITPLLSGRVTTYGHSMGGYAALKYSAVFGADTVLAFSPQATISPEEAPGNVTAVYYDDALHRGMRIEALDVAGKAYVFADPYYAEDMRQLERLPRHPGLEFVPVFFVRHSTSAACAGTALMADLLTVSLARDRPGLDALIRRGKRGSGVIHLALALDLIARGKPDWAMKTMARAHSLGLPGAQTVPFYVTYGRALDQTGNLDGAVKAFRRAMACSPTTPRLHHSYVSALIRSGRHAEARSAVEVSLSYCPGEPTLVALKGLLAA